MPWEIPWHEAAIPLESTPTGSVDPTPTLTLGEPTVLCTKKVEATYMLNIGIWKPWKELEFIWIYYLKLKNGKDMGEAGPKVVLPKKTPKEFLPVPIDVLGIVAEHWTDWDTMGFIIIELVWLDWVYYCTCKLTMLEGSINGGLKFLERPFFGDFDPKRIEVFKNVCFSQKSSKGFFLKIRSISCFNVILIGDNFMGWF